jgi:hypothetical protein
MVENQKSWFVALELGSNADGNSIFRGGMKFVEIERMILRVFVLLDVAFHLTRPLPRFQIRHSRADSPDAVVF